MKTRLLILILLFFNSFLYAQVSDFKHIDFTRANTLAKLNNGASIENLPLLAYKLTHKLPTKVEQFRAIYSWVCSNIEGDNNQQNKIERKRRKYTKDSISLLQWNTDYKKIVFRKLLKTKKTMCTGYAYLIKELCFLTGIECVIVDGYGRTISTNVKKLELANHSWNAVKLNNKWYLCDATWSSGYLDEMSGFVKDYNDGYFLTDPVLFGNNHYPLKEDWLLNNTLSVSNFVKAPLVYGEAFKHDILVVSPEKMNVSIPKNKEISFSFKSIKDITCKNVALVYCLGIEEKKCAIYDIKNKNGLISFKYRFKHKGNYDVHLKINNDIVATYTVKVTKNLMTSF